jgi:hypothetical protein
MSQHWKNRTPLVIALVGLCLVVGSARAAGDEEEDVPLDTKIIRGILSGLGFRRDGEKIDYQERSPLVVPPTRDLPPPDATTPVVRDPNWPKDNQLQQAKATAAKRKNLTAARQEFDEGQVLRGEDLRKGTVQKNGSGDPTANNDVIAGKPLPPSALGGSGNWFKDMKQLFSKEPEYATFTNEPTRNELTQPPVGYQTPSPNQPYGLNPRDEKRKATTLEDRAVGYEKQ